MKVVKVLNGAVQFEDGRVRNLRHVSLFKASITPQEFGCEDFDEESGYLWGYEDARPDRGEGGGEFPCIAYDMSNDYDTLYRGYRFVHEALSVFLYLRASIVSSVSHSFLPLFLRNKLF
ncbi:hypothetical protein NDU88_008257 [Pleurodeles waltl]|uniref:Uncharacterized protein n=1 Tax=Pleurodeles waltl TaxID=8319 RepID=A0AAV7VWN6_PLEWA|nr:hypothetical protein NDU88_008257 [Pleurodeles waltl]